MNKKITLLSFIMLLTSCTATTPYTLTIDGNGTNFSGYYYVDGQYVEDFSGEILSGDHYYYDKELEEFDSIYIYAEKDGESCALTITVWEDNKKVAELTSVSYESTCTSYDSDGNCEVTEYVLPIGPLYYEPEDDSTSTTTTTTE